MQIKEVASPQELDDKGKEVMYENSLLAQTLNKHFERFRPELTLHIKQPKAPPLRDFRLKKVG